MSTITITSSPSPSPSPSPSLERSRAATALDAAKRTASAAQPQTRFAQLPNPAANAIDGATSGGLVIPDWVKDAVFYQVFTERFANGDMGNDPQGTEPWGTKPWNEQMQGGDLNGVAKRMDYLATLGVNALYFNPIFEAHSNHKYNTASYDRIDPDFGGREGYEQMLDASERHGMKVVLDGVFNHVSHQHDWFKDVREHGRSSRYWDRFTVRNWPIDYTRDNDGVLRSDDYESWWGYATLPVLNTNHPDVRETFLTGSDAIIKKWVRDGRVHGWRMDVADDTNFSADYWRTARRELKSVAPDAYMVAENWKDASSMLQGDQFDGTMNYQYFTWPAVDFFAKKSTSVDEFVGRLANGYSREARHGAFNILDSHDTPRFITQAGGDWYRQRPAAIFQMTYIGAPVIYYGDEIGMEGAADPDSRRAMEWQHAEGAVQASDGAGLGAAGQARNGARVDRQQRADQLFSLYRTLIAARKESTALRRGDFQVLATHNDDNTLVFRRAAEGDPRDAIVAINNSTSGKDIVVPLGDVAQDGTRFTDALGGTVHEVRDGRITLRNVDGNYGAVLLRATDG